MYLDLDALRATHGDDFVIEYKYFVRNKLGHVFWEHGKINRKIRTRDLVQINIEMQRNSAEDGNSQSLLVIEDQKYNNLLLQSRMYVASGEGII